MINLGRTTAEYEEKEIRVLFEEPENYQRLIRDENWIIIGRKGSGKSSIVDFESALHSKQNYSIRPGRRLSNTIMHILC